MSFVRTVVASLVLVGVAVPADAAMTVQTFLSRANALRDQGPMALMSPDLPVLKAEAKQATTPVFVRARCASTLASSARAASSCALVFALVVFDAASCASSLISPPTALIVANIRKTENRNSASGETKRARSPCTYRRVSVPG